MQIEIVASENPTADERAAVLDVLVAHNESRVGRFDAAPVAWLLREGADGATIGGLWARPLYDWLLVEYLAVPDALRGRGIGSDLMRRAEALARRRRYGGIWLHTYAFQARPFYEKLGYEIFGTLDDNPPGMQHAFMRKRLTGSAEAGT